MNANAPKPKVAPPQPQSRLSERAKREQRRLVRLLRPMGVLTVSDGPALELLSEAMAEYGEAREVLARDGQSYECITAAGAKMRRVRPEQAVAADAMRRAVHLLEAFGLTPAARAKVEALPAPSPCSDPLDEFIRRRHQRLQQPDNTPATMETRHDEA